MKHEKPLASISLDLDNLWAYLKVKEDSRWMQLPSYFEFFIPYVLDILDETNLKITFFIVGQDADQSENKDLLKEIVNRGHEVANHSYYHEPWLCQYSQEKLEHEILIAEEKIYEATGQHPIGFRGPGFAWSPQLLQLLSERNYLYDSTTFPTFLGPLARAYYQWKTKLSKDSQESRSKLYGSFADGFRSLQPYLWNLDKENQLLEIPVTTIPIIRFPFHMTYLMYLWSVSPALMRMYFQTALQACRITQTGPNFLLHPTDFLGIDRVPEMDFFPGMDVQTCEKKEVFLEVISKIKSNFYCVNMSERARKALEKREELSLKEGKG